MQVSACRGAPVWLKQVPLMGGLSAASTPKPMTEPVMQITGTDMEMTDGLPVERFSLPKGNQPCRG